MRPKTLLMRLWVQGDDGLGLTCEDPHCFSLVQCDIRLYGTLTIETYLESYAVEANKEELLPMN
jgi:hypothetical protein